MRLRRRTACLLAFSSVMFGCAGAPKPVLLPDPPAVIQPEEPPAVAIRQPPMEVAELDYVPHVADRAPVSTKASRTAVSQAASRHTMRPSAKDFHGVKVQYPWIEDKLWAIEVEPHKPVHLLFDLVDGWLEWSGMDTGEKGWWEVKEKKTGTPPHEQGHLLVTAKEAGKRGEMTVLTGRGAIYLSFHSIEDGGMTAVSWKHPPAPPITTARNGAGVFYTGYQRSTIGHAPLWTPDGIWDSGEDDGRTLIHFPKALKSMEAPLLWVIARDGAKHLVNYRVKGQWYIVDQLFERGELRVGPGDDAEVIIIERGPSYRGIRCPGDEACPPGGWS